MSGTPISTEAGAYRFLSDKNYDRAKFVNLLVLPAIGTLYFALSQIWGFQYGQEVLGSILAVQACLGVILGISSNSYKNSPARYDGELNVIPTLEGKTFSLELNDDPELLESKGELVFKVNRPEPPKEPVRG